MQFYAPTGTDCQPQPGRVEPPLLGVGGHSSVSTPTESPARPRIGRQHLLWGLQMSYTSNEDPNFTPIPDAPLPGPMPPLPPPGPPPQPGPVPGLPQPGPFPWPPRPPEFWRCWRRRGVSGRYDGVRSGFFLLGGTLDLRVDIDQRFSAESPVMNRVSGDFYVTRFVREIGLTGLNRTYVSSWIVDAPQVTWGFCSVTITGSVRYWQGTHPATSVSITIPWSYGAIGTGTATFTSGGSPLGATYTLTYRSDHFREVNMEIDFCASVNAAPQVPSYGTVWHNNRPADTADRTLTIESAYRETGVGVTIDPGHAIIDDSAPGFTSWSPAELHDAMATNFSQYSGTWPSWNLWGLLAGTFETPSVGGVMFDAAAGFGGAGQAPERQGFAVFRNHTWFDDLVVGTPSNQDQARAMRQFLYTWVHEAGHAYNLLHSWNKARSSALSWMNYDWKYDQINGPDSFWAGFRFRFDDEELIHVRHGDRASVIMGGDPWASGGHLESPPGAMAASEPNTDVEFLVRSKTHFAFMEPVEVEFRLRNLSAASVPIDARLDPRYGTTTVFVQRPDGSRVLFETAFCVYGTPELVELEPHPSSGSPEGPDRISALVPLTFGVGGFTFDVPGPYLIRAVYQGAQCFTTSNTHRVYVGYPTGTDEDRFAPDFFSHDVGLALALGGSMSPHLSEGLDTLRAAADRFADQELGVKAAAFVARSVGNDFYRSDSQDVLVRHHKADPQEALAVTQGALDAYRERGAKTDNLAYTQLVDLRAQFHVDAGQPDVAANEVNALADDLQSRGANGNVIAEVRSLAPAPGASTAKKTAKKGAKKRPPKK
jgi:hypothetical protein